MTVTELFNAVGELEMLHPCVPILWGDRIGISNLPMCKGVYVVARTADPDSSCEPSDLQLVDSHFDSYHFNREYERHRWLPSEPVLYIGQATRGTIRKRVRDFYRHKVGSKGPHAGGQILKLLGCERWVYWATANAPEDLDRLMLSVFRMQNHQVPRFGNALRGARKRLCRSR